jgi:hypothetical protein
MTAETRTLAQLQGQSIEQVLRRVLMHESALTVAFPDGREVLIRPKSQLPPLPALEGTIPANWKDAVYPNG